MEPFVLYHMAYCPFCIRVRQAAKKLKIDLQLIDIDENAEAEQMLLNVRQRRTVPVLEYTKGQDRTLMGESSDIVAFLKSYAKSGQ